MIERLKNRIIERLSANNILYSIFLFFYFFIFLFNKQKNKFERKNDLTLQRMKGFTLVEIMVSLSIFVVIMTIVMGSILSVLDISTKAQTKKTAIDNLNFSLESISRTVRFGTNYHCGSGGDTSQPADCSSGSNSLTVKASDGSLVTYSLSNAALVRSINGGISSPVTSPEIVVQSLTFRVFGSYPYGSGSGFDYLQPQVIITVSGIAGSANKTKTQSSFRLETTISQRKLDI